MTPESWCGKPPRPALGTCTAGILRPAIPGLPAAAGSARGRPLAAPPSTAARLAGAGQADEPGGRGGVFARLDGVIEAPGPEGSSVLRGVAVSAVARGFRRVRSARRDSLVRSPRPSVHAGPRCGSGMELTLARLRSSGSRCRENPRVSSLLPTGPYARRSGSSRTRPSRGGGRAEGARWGGVAVRAFAERTLLLLGSWRPPR